MESSSHNPTHSGPAPPSLDGAADAAAFDLFLEHEQRVLAGAPDEFEALCAARPTLEKALRRLRATALAPDPVPASTPAPGFVRAPPSAPSDALAGLDPIPPTSRCEDVDLLALAGADRTRATRYERRRELGRGAMGVVYEVWDRELARPLAMKVLAASSFAARDPLAHAQRLQRFLREVRTAAQLDHPGIVPVHDFGLDERGRPFFTMKLVQGRELKAVFADVWRGQRDWTLARAVGALLKVCEAIEFAHAKGVVHRDLKPANVMIGPFGEVFVMDWGVAHLFEAGAGERETPGVAGSGAGGAAADANSELTDDGDVLGTASYMAPEQALGKLDAIGPLIDVYALGAMLHHLLAEHAPYVRPGGTNSSAVVMARVLEGPPPALAQAAPRAPVELVSIAEKAMARDVAHRYPHMGALRADLRAWLEGRVVGAHDSGAWAQLQKWIARNRALSVAIAAALLALVGGALGVAYVESVRADQALADGERIRVEALTAQRTVDYFEDVFKGVAPSRGGGQVTVAEMLSGASQSLAQRLDEELAVRARVAAALGSAYLGLGLHREALDLLTRARADAVASIDQQSGVALDIQLRLAAAAISAPDRARARAVLEELAPHCAPTGHATDAQKLLFVQLLAANERESGRGEHALALLTEAATGMPPHSAGALALERQACDLLILLERHAEARQRLEALAALAEQADKPELRVEALGSVAWIALREGDLAEAALMFEAAITIQRQSKRRDETALAGLLQELGLLELRRGDGEAAEPLLREALAIRERSLGATHPLTLTLLATLADYLRSRRRLDECEILATRARDGWTRVGGEFSIPWSTALRVLAQVNAERGRWAEAEAFARERHERSPPERKGDTRRLLDEIIDRQRANSDG